MAAMTRPDPHASYREHVSSEAEAVEEDVRCRHDVSEDCPACAEEEIASLRAQLATARKSKLSLLAHFYNIGSNFVEVARLCDEELDRSGALLGEVRIEAQRRAALNSGEQKQIEDWPWAIQHARRI